MNMILLLLTIILFIVGLVFTVIGYIQLDEGFPRWYGSRNIAELQGDANEVLLGIGWILTGIAALIASLVSSIFTALFWPKK